jgi:NADPH2:quinone reductase
LTPGPKVDIIDSPIPEPNDDQVRIKVVVSGCNPKDWKLPEWIEDKKSNTGDDIAGIVDKVGANVTEFKPGDRVAAFHEMMTPHGSFAEYAIAWPHTTFHIPKHTSFEGATPTIYTRMSNT